MPGYRRGPVGSFDTPQDLDKTTTPDNSAIFLPMTPPGQFSPAPDANLVAWYDMSKLPGANGSAITSIPDLSGHNNDLVPSAIPGSTAPTVLTPGLNGLPVAHFGSTQLMQCPNDFLGRNGVLHEASFIVVFRPSNTSGTNSVFLTDNDQTSAPFDLPRVVIADGNVIGHQYVIVDVSGTRSITFSRGVAPPYTNGTWYLIGQRYGGGLPPKPVLQNVAQGATPLVRFYTNSLVPSFAVVNGPNLDLLNGTQSAPVLVGGAPNSPLSGSSVQGDIAEMLFYSEDISDAQHTAVFNYLKKKWALNF